MRLSPEREKEIRESIEYMHSLFHLSIERELLAEIDALRGEKEMLRSLHLEAVQIRTQRQMELHAQDKELTKLRDALQKIADPRLRHHEPDKYTELGCVMNIANEALKCE